MWIVAASIFIGRSRMQRFIRKGPNVSDTPILGIPEAARKPETIKNSSTRYPK
jgi:hypothetical protein